jgi:nucleoside-diphosphate-sugar epimerase
MKALITGASGFVGSHLTPRAVMAGYDVRILLLPNEEDPFPQLPLEVVHGDILDAASLGQAFSGVDIVFHLAGYVGGMSGLGKYEQFMKVNVHGLSNVLEQARMARAKRLIHVSSIAAVGRCVLGRNVTEDVPRELAGYGYGDSKAIGEELVEKSGIQYVIARPTLIVGERDSVVFRGIAKSLEERKFRFIGDSNVIWSLVYAGDVAEALLLMAERHEAIGQIYNISSGEEVPYRELVHTIADELGLPRPEKKLPLWFAILLAHISSAFEKTLGSEPLISMAQIEPARHDMHASAKKLTEQLGFEPKVTWREAVHKTAIWWKEEKHKHSEIET